MDNRENKEFDLYKDIQARTNGEIYIGVVGPVRTGKSTFIKRFMDLFVLPYMEDENEKMRTLDEMPQSAAGKTIMTTEPKFIPKEAATIQLADMSEIKVRLIDCVGFVVEGANGYLEGETSRMVKTPWFKEEIPFSSAAFIGTEKVITDHATIGVVITTDGSIGELEREDYLKAERETIERLQQMKKPFVVVLNCTRPYSEETQILAESMEETYGACVIPLNCMQMNKADVFAIMEAMLMEFPVQRLDFYSSLWIKMLPAEHPLKESVTNTASRILMQVNRMKDVKEVMANVVAPEEENTYKEISISGMNLSNGTVSIRMDIDEAHYFAYISELTGETITGEYQMLSLLKSLSAMKNKYEKIKDAFDLVEQKGYGVVMPALSDIKMEEPVLIQHGGKYGVKMRAMSPSVHMIKANIETEIAPIVGNEEQARDLIAYIKSKEEDGDGLWTTNIFGKSIGELMEDGIRGKITKMDDECQLKLQDTMQKIVNDSNGGMICIII